MEFCGKSCMHGHPCRGLKDENACLPCLSCNDANQKHTANDMCMICYTEPLHSSPCIKLECDHIFHYDCVRQILEKRWIGPRITFGFSRCPICKTRVSHPSLEEVLQPINSLFEDVKIKSLTRLQYEGLFNCDAINKPGGIFYQDPARYAMERYAYYECSKCGKIQMILRVPHSKQRSLYILKFVGIDAFCYENCSTKYRSLSHINAIGYYNLIIDS
ncbi:MYCBP2 [Mytilus coruscus]|uniref:RCR-type E3 ubiquitin transferase n=1 Tax=Mytilus coruscus TaxID=42192 RepID=A0A6J8EUI9_MYTCO|nr:MYCBP2 [Mytilus coruscus]